MTPIFHRRNLLVLILAASVTSWAANKTTSPATKADRVVIVKSTHTLQMSHGQVLKAYKIALGGDPVGPKIKAGDKRTPEGEYVIDSKKSRSRFHLALHISYPNAADRERAQAS